MITLDRFGIISDLAECWNILICTKLYYERTFLQHKLAQNKLKPNYFDGSI